MDHIHVLIVGVLTAMLHHCGGIGDMNVEQLLSSIALIVHLSHAGKVV